MKLLITTQVVNKNDGALGFFQDWLLEFSKKFEKVTVICLEKGEYDLPENVEVLSLGKEARKNTGEKSASGFFSRVFSRLHYTSNFYKYIWQQRKNYDVVFVHMNPEYMALGGLFWRLWHKKTALWYVHRDVNLKLRIAEKLADNILTASRESFRLPSEKVEIVGHGVDVNKFSCPLSDDKKDFDIVYVGRISPIKRQMLLVEAVDVLVNDSDRKTLKVALVGGVSNEREKSYFEELKKEIAKRRLEDNIIFVGTVSSENIVNYYCKSKVAVNLCPTGGMDKAVLEAMSCGVPVVVYNKTFESILEGISCDCCEDSPNFSKFHPGSLRSAREDEKRSFSSTNFAQQNSSLRAKRSNPESFVLKDKSKEELAEKLLNLLVVSQECRNDIGKEMKEFVSENYSLSVLIDKIQKVLTSV